MIDDPYLLVRGGAVYLAVAGVAIAGISRRPDRHSLIGALLALAWTVPALLLVHLTAMLAGWWSFDASGGELFEFPVDLWLAWAVLWGPVPAIAFPRTPLWMIVIAALLVDLAAMPAAAPVVDLGPNWLIGEALALACCIVPAQLLARWTRDDRRLAARATLQVIAFSTLTGVLIPAIAVAGSGSTVTNPLDLSPEYVSIVLQLLAVPAILGLSAVQEFVTRGHGTPVPLDPPRRLVTTGPYAYVANPMQLAAIVILLAIAAALGNIWIAVAAVIAHVYSIGLAGWDEGEDLRARFGDPWVEYRRHVRKWYPRWRPWYSDAPVGTLFVSFDCTMCGEVAAWFARRRPRGLTIAAAETLDPVPLRITYRASDGSHEVAGVQAIGRALEHINLAYAWLGFALRLPILSSLIQLIVDASGGGPRNPRVPLGSECSVGSEGRLGVDPKSLGRLNTEAVPCGPDGGYRADNRDDPGDHGEQRQRALGRQVGDCEYQR